ncbi:hypothetical protein PVAP13_3NG038500 [Panicum virgatum]|uniref:Uncharacterized protein n=1 Tax=Panicum virgatum TaxID=38727 RepID=A0A8T0U405_PANVG|nr:hypothetical protein PVAP13_3NG038500 [Panicum virgatum]
MAASHGAAIAIVTSLLLLASSQSSLVHARMMPRDDHSHSYVQHAIMESPSSSPSVSQDLLTAPPTLLVLIGKQPEIATAVRRQTVQVVVDDGSVPSPGVGHHH